MIVVDASVAVKWFVEEPGHDHAVALLACEEDLIAPDLLVAETLHALRKKVRGGEVTAEQFLAASRALPGFLDRFETVQGTSSRAAEQALALDHGYYDCVYLAIAEAQSGLLVTADERFATKAASAGYVASISSLAAWHEAAAAATTSRSPSNPLDG